MKYILMLVMTLLLAVCGTLLTKDLLNKDAVLRLVGRGGPKTVEDPIVIGSLGGSMGEKLERRAKELDERAMKLDEDENRLKQEIRRFDDLRAEVEDKIKEIRGELDSKDSVQQDKLKAFAKTISAMGDKEAAKLLETLEPDELIGVFNHLDPKDAGKILSNMDPTGKAGDLTKEIVSGTQ